MSTVTAPQACLRRASAQAPGARYAGPLPPLHRVGHCRLVHGFRTIDGFAKIGQQLLKTANGTPMPLDLPLPIMSSRVLNQNLFDTTALAQARSIFRRCDKLGARQ